MLTSRRALGATLAILFLAAVPASAELKLADNDRVVFFADQSLSTRYALEWLDQFLRARYPELKAEVYCAAQDGCTATEAVERLDTEILPLKPTYVVFSFGLDHAGRQAFQPAMVDSYKAAMGKMFDSVKAQNINAIAVTPPPIDDSRDKGLQNIKYQETVGKFAEALREVATEKNVPVIDWRAGIETLRSESREAAKEPFMSRGTQPIGMSLAVLCDKVLEHFGAEPMHYMAEADWQGDAVAATFGKVELTERSEHTMSMKLTGVPAPMSLGEPGDKLGNQHPLNKWQVYQLKIAHMPEGGALVSVVGKSPKPYLTQQFETGAYLTILPYFSSSKSIQNLYNAIRSKILQFEKYAQFSRKEAPEPELVEAYKLYAGAEMALAFGVYKIALRTPSSYDVALTVELAAHAAERQRLNPTPKPEKKRRPAHIRPKVKKRPATQSDDGQPTP